MDSALPSASTAARKQHHDWLTKTVSGPSHTIVSWNDAILAIDSGFVPAILAPFLHVNKVAFLKAEFICLRKRHTITKRKQNPPQQRLHAVRRMRKLHDRPSHGQAFVELEEAFEAA